MTAIQLPQTAKYATSISSRLSTLSIWHQPALLRKTAGLNAISSIKMPA